MTLPVLFPSHSHPKPRRAAFTLIELLVVISIIALLAAILFPVFGRARENARRSTCQSNMKQIGIGLMQYSQDYDERFPAYSGESYSTTAPFWHVNVQPYVKSEAVFRCPSVGNPGTSVSDFTYAAFPSYGLIGREPNTNVGNVRIYDYTGFPIAYSKEPSRTYMMTETQDTDVNMAHPARRYGWMLSVLGGYAPGTSLFSITPGNNNLNQDVHFGGYNVAFLDGHIKWVQYGSETGYIMGVQFQP